MSNGNNTNNVALAASILLQLLAQAGTLATAIQTAQNNGTDISNDDLQQMFAADDAARAQLQADINTARAGTPPAG